MGLSLNYKIKVIGENLKSAKNKMYSRPRETTVVKTQNRDHDMFPK